MGQHHKNQVSLLSSMLLVLVSRSLTVEQRTRVLVCSCCFNIVSRRKAIQLVDKCSHIYCDKCLHTMFRMAINDEASFPPKCCSMTIDLKLVKHLLHRPRIKAYEKVASEYTTPETDRRYCADSHCNSFLGRANNGLLRCGKCGNLTCNSCKDYAHPGPCKVERGRDVEKLDKDPWNLAAAEGWQHCSSCSRLVILVDGCNHITLVSAQCSVSCP